MKNINGYMEKKYDVGVIVGRFQLHELHEAHRKMIDTVLANHKKVLLFLGTVKKSPTTKNPLDFINRKNMILGEYPLTNLTILPLPDHSSDIAWSKELDARIREACPTNSIVIYGGRDSFIPSYFGSFPTSELEEVIGHSATQVRKELSVEVRNTPDFRAGIVYGVYNQYPKVYPTVDIALIKDNNILLGRKPGEEKWRFLGGFVDPTDNSFEESAAREAKEEAGVDVKNIQYVCTRKVNDWRYRGERDQIITTLYTAEPIGEPVAGDDIGEVKWFSLDNEIDVVDEHKPHFDILIQHLANKK
jgi:bifunctional NMN adenylyltransferase/nudix hydrolase